MTENRKATDLVPVADREALREHGIPYAPRTLRKMRCMGQHPALFVKIGGKLFVSVESWMKIVTAAKKETQARVERLKRLGLLKDSQAE